MSTRRCLCALGGCLLAAGCNARPDSPATLAARGEQIFFREIFAGNGRTCGSCHPAQNNFTIDPAFIATLPPDDPLFVAEFNPALRDLERPDLMRKFGLILENQDGFDDLANNFNMRGVPHTLGLRNTVESPQGPRTGWSGDGAPGDGSLRSFAVGAVIQHFTRSLDRIAGVDFRLPTDDELDALEAFMLSLGPQEELSLPLPLRGEVPRRGQELFLDDEVAKCNLCHVDAGATARLGGRELGNANFDTGVENLPDQPARLAGLATRPDDGLGIPGDGTFNTPSLVEAADTPPFFHNNSVATIEAAVAFYDGEAFNSSPAGRALAAADPEGEAIELDATEITAIAAFLRVINALENIHQTIAFLEESRQGRSVRTKPRIVLLRRALDETEDSIRVLDQAGLHPEAVVHLRRAADLAERAARTLLGRDTMTRRAIREQMLARGALIETGVQP
jgi:hypothetical protein